MPSGLARQGRFIDAEVVRAQQNAVGRDFQPFPNEHEIPGHQILAGNILLPAHPG